MFASQFGTPVAQIQFRLSGLGVDQITSRYKQFAMPIVGAKSTGNAYIEYGTSVIYEDWPGPVASHAVRVNVQYQLPVGL